MIDTVGTLCQRSHLFFLLIFADQTLDQRRFSGLTEEGLELAEAALAPYRASASEPFSPSGGVALEELQWAAALSSVGARLGLARLRAGKKVPTADLPVSAKRPLRRELVRLDRALEGVWLSRSRRGGLALSRKVLQRVIDNLS